MKPSLPSFPHLQLAPLYLCKLSSILSEQAFLVHLQSFTQSKEKRIMLLVSQLSDAQGREGSQLVRDSLVLMYIISLFSGDQHAGDLQTDGQPH